MIGRRRITTARRQTHLPRFDRKLVKELAAFEKSLRSKYIGFRIVLGIAVDAPQVDQHRAAFGNGVADALMLVDIVLR